MSRFLSVFLSKICPLFAAASIFSFTQTANATVWNVDAVLSGDGGFGASLFHEASSPSGMSGDIIHTLPNGPVISGTFNDVTGAFDAEFNLVTGSSSLTLMGTLIFGGGGFGELTSASTLDVNFLGTPHGGLADTTLGYNPGFVCCGNNGDDPNSFHDDSMGGAIMTLWGADNFKLVSGEFQYNAEHIHSDIGMDLRIQLTPVPIPAALPLFGTGLGLLGFLGWRRRRKVAGVA